MQWMEIILYYEFWSLYLLGISLLGSSCLGCFLVTKSEINIWCSVFVIQKNNTD